MEDDKDAPTALVRLGGLLSDPFFRKAFAANPAAALAAQGIAQNSLPVAVLEVLAGLSHEELRALSRVKNALELEHASTHERLEMV